MTIVLELRIPDHVHSRTERTGATLLLDTVVGAWFVLNGTGGALWREWAQGLGFDEGVSVVAAAHPEVPAETIRDDARALLSSLVENRLLEVEVPRTEGGTGVEMVGARRRVEAGDGAQRWRRAVLTVPAFPVLLLAAGLLRLSFRRSLSLVRATRSNWCLREASPDHAEDIAAAVGRAARWYPGRAACLEQSLACVLLAALLRRRVLWCLGAEPDPYRFHAWVEVNGTVVGDPAAPAPQPAFRAALAL